MRVPPAWTVQAAHELADRLEAAVDAALPGAETFVHVEPHQPSDHAPVTTRSA